MRIVIALSLLCSLALAQIAVDVTLPTGATLHAESGETLELAPRCTLRVGESWLAIRHEGQPRHWGAFRALWSPEAFAFRSIVATIPEDWLPVGLPLNGARDLSTVEGRTLWALVPDDAALLPDPDIPGSDASHVVIGGETIAWRFRPRQAYLEALPTQAARDQALAIIQPDLAVYGRYPEMQDALRLWGGTVASAHLKPPGGAPRDLLWRLIRTHWKSAKGSDWPLEHWYLGGDIPWAEGSCNAHYNGDLWTLLNGLTLEDRNEARLALTLGMWIARSKAEKGLIWSQGNRFRGWWHYEKGRSASGSIGRRGRSYFPQPYKEWDRGLLVASVLAPDDVLLQEAVALRRVTWLARKPSDLPSLASGRYGARVFGRMLTNLLVWHRWAQTTGDNELRDHCVELAAALRERGMGFARTSLWFRDGTTWAASGNRAWAPWMQAQALSATWAWSKPGAPLEITDAAVLGELRGWTQHLLDMGRPVGTDYWQIPAHVTGYPSWEVEDWGHPILNGWLHPVWAMAAQLGIEEVAGMKIEEAAIRSRDTAFRAVGRGWSNMDPKTGDLLEHVGGVRGALGAADSKLLAGLLSGALK